MDVLDAHQVAPPSLTVQASVIPCHDGWGEVVAFVLVRPPALLTLTVSYEINTGPSL